jgi:glutamyl-tRNA reductase
MPGFVMIGVSHHAAPVDVRERVAIDEATWRQSAPEAVASVLISTCNRVEIYAWVDGRAGTTVKLLQRSLARAAGIELSELLPYVTARTGRDALLHLVRVVSGLDSLVVGEEQIRGQVREALRDAEAAGPMPAALRGVFQRTGESARRIRGTTSLAHVPSIASAGINVACRLLGQDLKDQVAVVLGAGVIARSAVESLLARGARVVVLNRTPSHAERVMAHLGQTIQVAPLDTLPEALVEAVLVVGATASRIPVVGRATVEAAVARRDGRRLMLLDIALPRDVEASVRDLPGATLIDLDDLERECPVDINTRHAELRRAESLAVKEADRLAEWLHLRAVSPAIAELRTYAETIRKSELRRSASRLRDLTPEQIAAVDALTSGIVNKLMHGPTVALRDAATRPGGLVRSRTRILRVLRPTQGRTG